MNNSNICPIVFSNRSEVKNNLEHSLEYYQQQTIEHVRKYLPIAIINGKKKNNDAKVKKIIHYILSNDDMLSNITTAIMLADFTHDQSRGSLRYWRTKNCIWTLNKTFYKNKIRPIGFKCSHTNRNQARYEPGDGWGASEVADETTPLDSLLKKEQYTLLDQKIDSLEKREKEIIKLYYLDNMNENEIGKRFSITQQRVSKILIETKKRLNNERI